MTSGSLRYYYRDEVNNETNEKHPAGNYRINTSKTTTNKSFEYKTKIIRPHQMMEIYYMQMMLFH